MEESEVPIDLSLSNSGILSTVTTVASICFSDKVPLLHKIDLDSSPLSQMDLDCSPPSQNGS